MLDCCIVARARYVFKVLLLGFLPLSLLLRGKSKDKNANVETRYYTPTKKTAAKMGSLAWTAGPGRSRRKVVGAAHRRTERGHRTRCDSMSERPQEVSMICQVGLG